YDPVHTSYDMLMRIRNWLLPDKKLFPVSLTANRAQILWEIENLTTLSSNELRTMRYEDVQNKISLLRNNTAGWIITSKLKPFFYKQKSLKNFATKKEMEFGLFRDPVT